MEVSRQQEDDTPWEVPARPLEVWHQVNQYHKNLVLNLRVMNLLEGPWVSSAQGEFASAQERCIWYGLTVSLAYPSGEEGDNFLVEMIFTCRRYT